MKRKAISIVMAVTIALGIWSLMQVVRVAAQIPISSGFSYTQNFDGIGTSATATLPTDWRVDKQTAVRTVGTFAAAGTATERAAGANLATNAANGIYNFGAGTTITGTDRAVGWLASSGGTASGNLYVHLVNTSTKQLGSLNISYDIEKYRKGLNPAGFIIQLYYSIDGSTWITAGTNFSTSFSADITNTGFTPAPGVTISVVSQVLTFTTPITPTGELFLAWNYSVSTGSTTTNAQGLGIDSVHIDTPLTPTAITLNRFDANSESGNLSIVILLIALSAIMLSGALIARRRRI